MSLVCVDLKLHKQTCVTSQSELTIVSIIMYMLHLTILTLNENNVLYVVCFMSKKTGMHVLVYVHVQYVTNMCIVQVQVHITYTCHI